METESYWIIWIILCAAFIIAEIFTASFFAGPMGFGCLVASILAKIEIGTAGQLLGFSVTSVVLLLAIRPIWLRMMESTTDDRVSGVDAYIGKQGRITETVDPQIGTGRIQIGGENWVAISDKNITLEEGSQATVVRVEGTKAIVSVSENP